MRILVISDYRSFHTVRPEAEIFIGLAKKGVEVTVMTYSNCEYGRRFKNEGIKVIDFHPEKKFDKNEIIKIRQCILENKIDIIHLFNSKAIINGIQAAKDLKVKIVLYRGFTGNIHWYDPSMYFKYLHPAVDAIQCNSIGVSQLFQKQLFFKKEKAIPINKGHKSEWYSDVIPKDLRAEFKLPDDSFILINVANNRKMKGIPYLLKAISELPDNLPIYLVLVGRDMDTRENIKLLVDSNKKDRVVFTGFREDALALVGGADAFILSSITGESITKAVIEAMSLGVPPIITDIPGNTELIKDDVSGIRVRYKSSDSLRKGILKMYSMEKAARKKMGENAKLHIDQVLNTETTVNKVYEMYTQLLNTNK